MSNAGKWTPFYRGKVVSEPYGDSASYRLGAEWLDPCDVVADWGCGLGWFRRYWGGEYRGIDGTKSRFSDIVVDLTQYKTPASGIFMRHVLEHNYEWRAILDNALEAFELRMFLALFTLWTHEDVVELQWEEEYGVPTLGFNPRVIEERMDKAGVRYVRETIASPETFYHTEHLYRISR